MLHVVVLTMMLADFSANDIKFMNSLLPAIATCPKVATRTRSITMIRRFQTPCVP